MSKNILVSDEVPQLESVALLAWSKARGACMALTWCGQYLNGGALTDVRAYDRSVCEWSTFPLTEGVAYGPPMPGDDCLRPSGTPFDAAADPDMLRECYAEFRVGYRLAVSAIAAGFRDETIKFLPYSARQVRDELNDIENGLIFQHVSATDAEVQLAVLLAADPGVEGSLAWFADYWGSAEAKESILEVEADETERETRLRDADAQDAAEAAEFRAMEERVRAAKIEQERDAIVEAYNDGRAERMKAAHGQPDSANGADGEPALPSRKLADLSDVDIATYQRAFAIEAARRAGKGDVRPYSVRPWDEVASLDLPPPVFFWGRCFGLGYGAVRIHAIFGQGGLGKSRVALNLARNQVLGIPFGGLPTNDKPLRHLLMGSENSIHRLQGDCRKMQSGLSAYQLDALKSHVFLATLEAPTDPYVTLADPANVERWRLTLEQHRPDVLWVDPWGDIQNGDANSDSDTRSTVATLAKLLAGVNPNSALVVVAHARTGAKNIAEATGYDGANFGKGSKALFSCARAAFNLAPGDETENPPVVMACPKNNDGLRPAPFALVLNTDTMTYNKDEDFDFDAWMKSVADRALGKPAKGKRPRLTEPEAADILGDDTGTLTEVTSKLRDAGAGRDEAADLLKRLVAAGVWETWRPSGKNQPIYIGPPGAIRRRRDDWTRNQQRPLSSV